MKKKIISLCAITTIMVLVIFASCDKFMKIVTVKTTSFSDLKLNSVVLKGEVVSTGSGKEVSERGFFYGTNKAIKPAITVNCGAGGKGSFEAKIKGLQPGTKYYFKAYATNDEDMDTGDVIEFTTYALKSTVTTNEPEPETNGNVTLSGSYENKDNLNIEKVGFEYAKNGNFDNASVVYANTHQSPFSANVVLDAASYYCRAFIQDEDSLIVYGNTIDFVPVIPTVITEDASDITDTSAILNASVSGEINNKGFYFSTMSDFSDSIDIFVGSGSGSRTFFTRKKGLTPSTTYYYKAYVTYHNGSRRIIGELKSFRTQN